jgi:hypothetical protein
MLAGAVIALSISDRPDHKKRPPKHINTTRYPAIDADL